MPLYEYECAACGQRFEVIQKFSDPPADACRRCGKGPVQRLMSSPAIQFKGSGWYITDYAGKGKSDSSSTTPAGKTADSGKPDSAGATAARSDNSTSAAKSETAASTPKSKE